MNLVYSRKNSEIIAGFISNCIKRGNTYEGDTPEGKFTLKQRHWDFIWTEDIINPVLDGEGNQTGWDKTVAEITPATEDLEIKEISHSDYVAAMKMRKILDKMDYNDIEDYINTNVVDLPTARDYLIKLSKVVLALTKIVDKGEL